MHVRGTQYTPSGWSFTDMISPTDGLGEVNVVGFSFSEPKNSFKEFPYEGHEGPTLQGFSYFTRKDQPSLVRADKLHTMVFTVFVAGKVSGVPLNYELTFPKQPSVDQLRVNAEREFGVNGHTLKVGKMKVRVGASWVELGGDAQIVDHCQVFVMPMKSQAPPQAHPHPAAPAPAPRVTTTTSTTTTYRQSTMRAPSPAPRTSHAPQTQQPTFTDKVSFCHDWIQTNSVIRREDFARAFEYLPSIQHKAPDLFTKSDTNLDGTLDHAEFQRFGEIYPTILDCLYYRLKDEVLRRKQEEEMQKQSDLRRNGQAIIDDANRQHRDALDATTRFETALKDQTGVLSDAHRGQQNAMKNLESAKHATRQAKAELQDLLGQRGGGKDEEVVRRQKVTEVAEQLQTAQTKVTEETAKRSQAEQKLVEIRRLLEEQERVVRHHDGLVRRATDRMDMLHSTHQVAIEAVEAAERDGQRLNDRIKEGEAKVASCIESVRSAMGQHRDKENEVAREQAKRDLIERELQSAHEKEALRKADAQLAAQQIGDCTGKIDAMMREHQALLTKIKTTEDDDATMLRQEVALREQREDLEKYEANLRTDHRQFLTRQANKTLSVQTVFTYE